MLSEGNPQAQNDRLSSFADSKYWFPTVELSDKDYTVKQSSGSANEIHVLQGTYVLRAAPKL